MAKANATPRKGTEMTTSRDSIADIWGPRTPHGPDADWPIRVDEQID